MMKGSCLKRCAAAMLVATLLASCGGGGQKSDEADSTPPANPTLLVSAVRAAVHPMKSEVRLLGKTVAPRHVIVRAPTTGRVMGMKLVTGDSVRKGQVVARVINREIEAAEAGLAVARRIDPNDAPAMTASVKRYDHGVGIPVVAPESGIVSQTPVASGQMVADLDTMVDLIDPANLYIETQVPVNQLSTVKPGMPATVTTPFRPGVEFPARIAALLPNFDATSATSSVRTDFTGPERIAQAGAPVEVRVETASAPDAVAIPVVALFQDQGENQYHVFAIGPDGKAHRTEIKVGLRDRDLVQVTQGLKVGDLVVTSGGYALSDGLSVRVAQGNQ